MLPTEFQDKTFPCPLCEEPLDIRMSTKARPYVICNDCGLQLFIRYDKGIKRLKKLLKRQERGWLW